MEKGRNKNSEGVEERRPDEWKKEVFGSEEDGEKERRETKGGKAEQRSMGTCLNES